MRNLERPSTVIVVVAMLALAGLVGLAIPLASGRRTGSEQVAWTSPTPAPPTATPMETVVSAPTRTPTFTPFAAHTSKPFTATQPVEPTQSLAPTARTTATRPAPTAAPVRSGTPGLVLNAVVAVDLLNLRGGPGQGFGVIGLARSGETYTATTRSGDGAWLQICCFNHAPAWLATEMVTVTGAIDSLPVAP